MALPPSDTTNEAFLREVDEEYRRDQLLKAWRSYGRWIIAAVVVALLALAGYLYWQHHTKSVAGKRGEAFDAALQLAEQGQADKALPAFAAVEKAGGDGYVAIAKLGEASLLLQKNDAKGAAAKFAEVAGDKSLAQPFRDLALLRQTAAEYETLKPQSVIDRLKPLAVPGSPWFATAGEMVAAAQLKLGQRDAAGKLLGQIAQNPDAPQSIRQRAAQLAGSLGVDTLDQSKENQAR